jgi:hypothetical protein
MGAIYQDSLRNCLTINSRASARCSKVAFEGQTEKNDVFEMYENTESFLESHHASFFLLNLRKGILDKAEIVECIRCI